MQVRLLARTLVLSCCVVVMLLVAAAPASAHPTLLFTTPEADAAVAQSMLARLAWASQSRPHAP